MSQPVTRFKREDLNRMYNLFMQFDAKRVSEIKQDAGSVFESAFKHGYTGTKVKYIRTRVTYAAYIAGKDWRKRELYGIKRRVKSASRTPVVYGTPKPGDVIAVWFSCGAASAVAAKKTIEKYGHTCTILIVNNPIKEEDSDNRRFLSDVQAWLGVLILQATNSNYPNHSVVEVWDKRKYMAGVKGAPCTGILKKEARQQFEAANKIDWHVLGFTLEEKGRSDDFATFEMPNILPILVDEKLTKPDCFDIVIAAGIELPRIYKLGYPNANCIGCVKASSPTYWNHVRKVHPEVFAHRAEQSRRIGVRLVRYKGKRIFLDELPPNAKGRKMKSYECGIFCETKTKK